MKSVEMLWSALRSYGSLWCDEVVLHLTEKLVARKRAQRRAAMQREQQVMADILLRWMGKAEHSPTPSSEHKAEASSSSVHEGDARWAAQVELAMALYEGAVAGVQIIKRVREAIASLRQDGETP